MKNASRGTHSPAVEDEQAGGLDEAALKARLVEQALALGFDAVRVTAPDGMSQAGENLRRFVELGRHGSMGWMAERAEQRGDPRALWPEVRSIVMLGMNYGPAHDPRALLGRPDRGAISVYARGDDYHEVVKSRLKALGRWLGEASGRPLKVFVDTAPVMEKPLAQAAGVGWQGKHTNLVSREWGSWLFLGAIFTALDLPPDQAEADHCGSCRACLDVCPTAAFPAPYQLDARRCISYLTIELKEQIPREFREAIGNRVYGCDDCLAVCPWNKFAERSREMKLAARAELEAPRPEELARLDDAGFRALFRKSPVKRIGRDRFVRNVLVAVGNSRLESLVAVAAERLDDASPAVRGMAAWALSCLLSPESFQRLREARLGAEAHPDVREEWLTADVAPALDRVQGDALGRG